jgi:hypothetical protein
MFNFKNLMLGAVAISCVNINYAAAGNDAGHGGAAWVCRNADDSIRWVKLVDLFEAKNQYGLKLDSFTHLPVAQELAAVDAKVKSINPDAIPIYESTLATVKANFNISTDAAIVRIPDAQVFTLVARKLAHRK